jgi:hypothetical protein
MNKKRINSLIGECLAKNKEFVMGNFPEVQNLKEMKNHGLKSVVSKKWQIQKETGI